MVEPAISKIKSLRFATEAAITILRIDDFIKVSFGLQLTTTLMDRHDLVIQCCKLTNLSRVFLVSFVKLDAKPDQQVIERSKYSSITTTKH